MRAKNTCGMLAVVTFLVTTLGAQATDIVDTIAATPNLKTLTAAIKAAGIADTLRGQGPFTVFAPTDDAFKRLPANTVSNLMTPENKAQLAKILTYHVVPARLAAKDMDGKMYKTKTINGKEIEIDADDPGEGIKINKGKVTQPDMTADNGVIHEINRVLLP
jgi:uncharacterized surface protein with fasciclin (FAS1) repeats